MDNIYMSDSDGEARTHITDKILFTNIIDTQLNLSETQKFLSLLGDDKHYFQTFDDSEEKQKELTFSRYLTFADAKDKLIELNRKGAGIFVVINRTDAIRGKNENIVQIRAVFVDLDGYPIEPVLDAELQPHVIIETSPKRYRVFWLVRDMPLDHFTDFQKALIRKFNGDHRVHNLCRVMRLPGFFHNKDKPFLSRIFEIHPELPLYTPAEISAGLGLNPFDRHITTSKFSLGTTIPDGERDHTLFRYVCSMRSKGVPEQEILDILLNANNNRCQPPITDGQVTEKAKQALKYPNGTSRPSKKNEPSQLEAATKVKSSIPMICVDGVFYRYNGGVYTEVHESVLGQEVIDILGSAVTASKRNSILSLLKDIAYVDKKLVNPLGLLNLKNCILDIENKKTIEHSPNFLLTTQIDIDFNENATCPLWQKTIAEILPDRPAQDLLQQFAGYSLTTSTKYQVALVCLGYGANGKGTIFLVIQSLIGKNNYTTINIEKLDNEFEMADLEGKLVNFASETENGRLVNDRTFKAVIAGDEIRANRKFMKHVSFVPKAKSWISCNSHPETKDRSHGFWRRLLYLRFNQVFDTNDTNTDLNRAETIIKTELSGVLNWCLAGLFSLEKQGYFTLPECHQEELERHRLDTEPRIEFIKAYIEETCTDGEYLKDLFQAWRRYAEALGKTVGSDKALRKAIESELDVEITYPKNLTFIKNIRLRNDQLVRLAKSNLG